MPTCPALLPWMEVIHFGSTSVDGQAGLKTFNVRDRALQCSKARSRPYYSLTAHTLRLTISPQFRSKSELDTWFGAEAEQALIYDSRLEYRL